MTNPIARESVRFGAQSAQHESITMIPTLGNGHIARFHTSRYSEPTYPIVTRNPRTGKRFTVYAPKPAVYRDIVPFRGLSHITRTPLKLFVRWHRTEGENAGLFCVWAAEERRR
jgi:hypothetical protein